MAYSDSFPAIRPSFQFNADAGRLDPRISYSRSTTGTYFGTEKHLSSENLFLQSSDFDTGWAAQGLVSITGGQTDPSGGTDGWTLRENSATGFHRITQTVSASGEVAYTVYAKRNAGTRYLLLSFSSSAGGINGAGLAAFDLAGGATHTANGSASTLTNLSATQTASGNGYYKCVFKVTGTITVAYLSLSNTGTPAANNYGLINYAADGSSSLDIAFASLTTTGASDYQPTTTQIHREYAPTLQTAAINAPRFEYSPTDSASMGLLIEGSSTNAISYSDSLSNWNEARLTVSDNSAVGPTGSLNASLLTPTSANGTHSTNLSSVATNVTGTVTVSGYFKAAGYDYVTLGIGDTTTTQFAHALFNLSTGAYVANNVSGNSSYVSSSTESVGNGWWRLVATFSTTEANEKFVISPASSGTPSYNANWGVPTYAGDDYSGVLATGLQGEVGKSFASSLITSNSGSETTRAVDSATMVSSSLFDNGEGALFVENKQPNATQNNSVVSITDGGSSNYVRIRGNFSNFRGEVYNNAAIQADLFGGTNDTNFHKQCITFGNNNVSFYVDGNEKGSTDTTGVIPELNTIRIGWAPIISNGNQHIRRVAVYGSQISETEAAAITS